MKIAVIKNECSHGDKTTVIGTVKWIGDVKTHQGDKGDFKTQSLLVTDGEQTDDKRNSIFCGFYADKNTWEYLKGKEVTLHGTCNVYQGKMEMRGCNLKDYPKETQQAPQQGQQGGSRAAQSTSEDKDVDWDAKDLRSARQTGVNCATQLVCTLSEATKGASKTDEVEVKRVAELFVDYIYNGLPTGFDQFDKENPVEQDNKWEH